MPVSIAWGRARMLITWFSMESIENKRQDPIQVGRVERRQWNVTGCAVRYYLQFVQHMDI